MRWPVRHFPVASGQLVTFDDKPAFAFFLLSVRRGIANLHSSSAFKLPSSSAKPVAHYCALK